MVVRGFSALGFASVAYVLQTHKQWVYLQVKPSRTGPNLTAFSKQLQAVIAHQGKEDSKRNRVVKLALETLIQFDFGRYSLLFFAHEVVVAYMGAEDSGVRKAAALAARKVQFSWQCGISRTSVFTPYAGSTDIVVGRKIRMDKTRSIKNLCKAGQVVSRYPTYLLLCCAS